MSKITDAHAALVTLLGTTLFPTASGWNRLPNPYKPEENADNYLNKGWGLATGQGVNTDKFVGAKRSTGRNFQVVLTLPFEGMEEDAAGKSDVDLALFEAQALVINALEKDFSVGGETCYTKYVGDEGIEYVRGETDRFLMLRTNIIVEYFDDLT